MLMTACRRGSGGRSSGLKASKRHTYRRINERAEPIRWGNAKLRRLLASLLDSDGGVKWQTNQTKHRNQNHSLLFIRN